MQTHLYNPWLPVLPILVRYRAIVRTDLNQSEFDGTWLENQNLHTVTRQGTIDTVDRW